jgi:Tol biopolymer transport system component
LCSSYAGAACVYVRDTCLGVSGGCQPQTTLVSMSVAGDPIGGGNPSISSDGRYVAFNSTGASTGTNNVYLRDTCNGAPQGCSPSTVLISQSTNGTIGNANSHSQSVTADGRFVAFESYSTNLVPNDSNIWSDIFVRDTCIGGPSSCSPSTTRVSISTAGTQANNSLDYEVLPSISGDGRMIAWASDATNMVIPNVSGLANIYVRDTCFGAAGSCSPVTNLASVGNDGSIPNFGQNNQSMSANGRYIAFASLASNLVPGQTFPAGAWKDIFVRDTFFGVSNGCTPSTVRVSISNTPTFATQSNDTNDFPRISGDGHYVVFMSGATNLLPGVQGSGNTMVYLAKTGF